MSMNTAAAIFANRCGSAASGCYFESLPGDVVAGYKIFDEQPGAVWGGT